MRYWFLILAWSVEKDQWHEIGQQTEFILINLMQWRIQNPPEIIVIISSPLKS